MMLAASSSFVGFDALAWVLINSTWQGLLAVFVYGLCRRLTTSAAIRHAVGHACLLTFLLAQCVTLLYAFDIPILQAVGVDLSPTPLNARGTSIIRDLPETRFGQWLSFIAPALPWVAIAWMAAIISRLAWTLWLLGLLRREVRRCTDLIEPFHSKFKALAAGVRGCSCVRFVESIAIAVPGTAGWLRPVILLPAGWVLNVTPQHAEAIILHELAHIARRDFVTNCIRSVVAGIYFFHLPLLWMLTALAEDAEKAADDFAASRLGDPHAYGSALLELEALRASPLLLGANGGDLDGRLRHLIEMRRGVRRNTSAVLAAFTAGLFVIILFAYNAAGAATNDSTVRWLETRNLSAAVIEILAVDRTNAEAEAMIDRLRGQPLDAESLDALAASLTYGFDSTALEKNFASVPPEQRLSLISFPTFGTTLERRALVNAMTARAMASVGVAQRSAARAALMLAAIDLMDRNGTAVQMLISKPEFRTLLRLDRFQELQLEQASAMHDRRAKAIVKRMRETSAGERANAVVRDEMKRLTRYLPAQSRMIEREGISAEKLGEEQVAPPPTKDP